MNPNKKNNPLSAYVIAGHLAFAVAAPLLFFIGGGMWLADYFELPDWSRTLFIWLGVVSMSASLLNYLRSLIKLYGASKNDKPSVSTRTDYYYDNEKT
jgi:hypothetical protein